MSVKVPTQRGALFFILALTTLVVIWFVQTQHLPSGDLFRGLWAPTFLLVRGENPYGLGAPDQTIRSVWFPMAIGLFSPLGWLSQFQAASAWFLVSVVSLVLIVRLAIGREQPGTIMLGTSFLMVFLFPPVISHLIIGQFSIFVTLMGLVSAIFLERQKFLPTGLLLAVSLTKPQLNLLLLPGFLLALWRIRNAKAVIFFLIALAGSIIWLTLPLWAVYPGWPNNVLEILRATPVWVQPSLFSVLTIQLGGWGILWWVLVTAGLFFTNLRIWSTNEPTAATSGVWL